ncbi:MAG: hypothetical protein ACI4A5_10930 [Hominilimicola sp.]
MQEFGESILENLVAEMDKRSKLFKAVGQENLENYRRATGEPLPRILVVIDEFQVLFNSANNRKVAMNCGKMALDIVTRGRPFGIHLLMSTQSLDILSELELSSATLEQMRIRIGLKCGERDARYLFTAERSAIALSMMNGPKGTAVMASDYMEDQTVAFRTAYCSKDDKERYLQLISEKYADNPHISQVFEGQKTEKLLDYLGYTDEIPVNIHMGTLIKVAPPLAISVDRRKNHNLLICGSDERMNNMVSNNYIISALLNKNSTVYCIDGDRLVGDDVSGDLYNVLLKSTSRLKVAEELGDIILFIREIYEEYQERKNNGSNEMIFVIIKDLQYLDIVQKMFTGQTFDESEYIDEPDDENDMQPDLGFSAIDNLYSYDDSTGKKLNKMIRNGFRHGICFVVTSRDFVPVKETMFHSADNLLSVFKNRVVFALNESDAYNLIEDVSVEKLPENIVYFTDGINKKFQLKPYIAPTAEELDAFLQKNLPNKADLVSHSFVD